MRKWVAPSNFMGGGGDSKGVDNTECLMPQGLYLIRHHLIRIEIPITYTRRSAGSLGFKMGIPISIRRYLVSKVRLWKRVYHGTVIIDPETDPITVTAVIESLHDEFMAV